MELLLCDEFRLLYAMALFAGAIAGAWRFVSRRVHTDGADRSADVALLVFAIQYVAVALPGVLGILSPISIAVTTLAISAGLYFSPWGSAARAVGISADGSSLDVMDRRIIAGCVLFAVGYMAAMIQHQIGAPVLSNDSLTYHFPAAVRWLQTGRLGLYETWFFNPANTYSPLAGSALIAWWMAPLGNDMLAKFSQMPPLALIFFASLTLARGLGVRPGAAALLALGLVLSKPFIRQALNQKDDLLLVGCFAAVFAGLLPGRMKESVGPWRIGVALGMALATKYTAIMMLPVCLLAVDAPFRAGWKVRHWVIALAMVLLLAGPWYWRNALLTGNPLYPVEVGVAGHVIFSGLFKTARSVELGGIASVWNVLTARDQSMPLPPTLALLLGLVGSFCAAIAWRAAVLRAPLIRICMIGPIVALGLFAATSPYPELRFFYPGFVLLGGALAVAINGWLKKPAMQMTAAGVFTLLCALTGLWSNALIIFVPAGMALVAAGFGAAALDRLAGRLSIVVRLRFRVVGGAIAGVAVVLCVYIYWTAAIKSQESNSLEGWRFTNGASAEVWMFVREHLPAGEPLAYTNTPFTYAMSGANLSRPVVYVPTRRNVLHLHDLPRLERALPGEEINRAVAQATVAEPDTDQWVARLSESGATHIVVFNEVVKNPRELAMIAGRPERFTAIYSNASGTVFRIKR